MMELVLGEENACAWDRETMRIILDWIGRQSSQSERRQPGWG